MAFVLSRINSDGCADCWYRDPRLLLEIVPPLNSPTARRTVMIQPGLETAALRIL